MGFMALTLARPVFPAGTQMRENIAAAAILDIWPSTWRQAHRSAETQHAPMHVDVFPRVPLAQDVRPLEVVEGDLDLPPEIATSAAASSAA